MGPFHSPSLSKRDAKHCRVGLVRCTSLHSLVPPQHSLYIPGVLYIFPMFLNFSRSLWIWMQRASHLSTWTSLAGVVKKGHDLDPPPLLLKLLPILPTLHLVKSLPMAIGVACPVPPPPLYRKIYIISSSKVHTKKNYTPI